jgi:hypothetical protein
VSPLYQSGISGPEKVARDPAGPGGGPVRWTVPGEGWKEWAACKGLPDTFYPESRLFTGPDYRPALAICATCPVRSPCLRYAVRHGLHDGVWGGTTPEQRDRLEPVWRERENAE